MKRATAAWTVAILLVASCASSPDEPSVASEATSTPAAASSEVVTSVPSPTSPSPGESGVSDGLDLGESGAPPIAPIVTLEESGRLVELLAWMKPPSGGTGVFLSDLRMVGRQAGLDPDCADDEALLRWATAIRGETLRIPLLWWDLEEGPRSHEREFGISLCEVVSIADTGRARSPMAWVVESPRERVLQAIADDDAWSSELEAVDYAGREILRWGDGILGDVQRSTPARPVGYGGQVILAGDIFVRSTNETELHSVLDAQDDDSVMASWPSVVELAEFMGTSGHHSAYIIAPVPVDDLPFGNGWPDLVALDAAVAAAPKLAAYDFFAVAWGRDPDENGFKVSFVVLNEDSATAEANAGNLEDVINGGVLLGGGPGATWADEFGTTPIYSTTGRLSIATMTTSPAERQAVWGRAIRTLSDAIAWFEA